MTTKAFLRIIKNEQVAIKLYVELLKNWHNSVSLSHFCYNDKGNARPNVAHYLSEWQREGYLTSTRVAELTKRKSKFEKKEEYRLNKIKYRANTKALIEYCDEIFSWEPKNKTLLFLNALFDNDLERSHLLRDISKPRFNIFERLLANIRNFLLEELQNYSSFIKYVKTLDKNGGRLSIEKLLVKYPKIIPDMVRGPFADHKTLFFKTAIEVTEERLEIYLPSHDIIDESFFKEMEKLFPEYFGIVRGLAKQIKEKAASADLEKGIRFALIQQMKKRNKSFNVFKDAQQSLLMR
ncbi:hypothetical protein HYY73_02040 [Candidatus Woesearchaeota archaeon]|nr:hypothetical protein [Candidatus Woesearchaeota archaeon]